MSVVIMKQVLVRPRTASRLGADFGSTNFVENEIEKIAITIMPYPASIIPYQYNDFTKFNSRSLHNVSMSLHWSIVQIHFFIYPTYHNGVQTFQQDQLGSLQV